MDDEMRTADEVSRALHECDLAEQLLDRRRAEVRKSCTHQREPEWYSTVPCWSVAFYRAGTMYDHDVYQCVVCKQTMRTHPRQSSDDSGDGRGNGGRDGR